MWKDFPQRAVRRAGVRGLVYSRPGYGALDAARARTSAGTSTSCTARRTRCCRRFLAAARRRRAAQPPWLFGHSDGGSIALLYAARFPARARRRDRARAAHLRRGLSAWRSIEAARDGLSDDRPARSASRGTTTTRTRRSGAGTTSGCTRRSASWNIEEEMPRDPLPAAGGAGRDDEYGTLAQVEGIAQAVPRRAGGRAGRLRTLAAPGSTGAPRRGGGALRRNPGRVAIADRLLGPDHAARRNSMNVTPKRRLPRLAAAAAVGLAVGLAAVPDALAQQKLKVGLMLPYTGTFAALGMAIENGFRLVRRRAGRQARRPRDRVLQGRRRIRPGQGHRQRQQADQARQRRRARRHRALGRGDGDGQGRQGQQHAADRAQRRRRRGHRPDVRARTSSAARSRNWQPGYAMGEVAGQARATRTSSRSPGSTPPATSRCAASREAFEKGGGKVVKELNLPFPNVEFQALLTEIAALKPDAVYTFFAGGGAVKFVKDYDAAGLQQDDPAVRRGLPHRRHARGAGRVGAGPADDAALRRRPRHAARQRVPRRLRRRPTSCSPTSTPCRATTRRRCWRIGLTAAKGDVDQARRASHAAIAQGEDRQPARRVHAVARPTTRCRTSTCARSKGKENRWSASPARRWPTRRAAASCSRARPRRRAARTGAGSCSWTSPPS